MTFNSAAENVYSKKIIKINFLKWITRLIVIKSGDKFYILSLPSNRFRLKDSANVSLMLSGTLEVCCNKLSKTKEILFEN